MHKGAGKTTSVPRSTVGSVAGWVMPCHRRGLVRKSNTSGPAAQMRGSPASGSPFTESGLPTPSCLPAAFRPYRTKVPWPGPGLAARADLAVLPASTVLGNVCRGIELGHGCHIKTPAKYSTAANGGALLKTQGNPCNRPVDAPKAGVFHRTRRRKSKKSPPAKLLGEQPPR